MEVLFENVSRKQAIPDEDRFERIFDVALRIFEDDYEARASARIQEAYGIATAEISDLEMTLPALDVTLDWQPDRTDDEVADAWAAAMWQALAQQIVARRLQRKVYPGEATATQTASTQPLAAPGRREGGAFLVVALTLSFQPELKDRQKFAIARHSIARTSLRAGADPLTPAEQAALPSLVAGIVGKVPKERPEVFEEFMPGPQLDVAISLMPQDLFYYLRGQYLPDPPVHAIADAIRNATRARRETQRQTSRGLSAKEYQELIRRGRNAALTGIDMATREKKERSITETISATLALEWAPDDYWFQNAKKDFDDAEERLKADDLVMTAHHLKFGAEHLQLGHDAWQKYFAAREGGAQRAVYVLGGIAAICAAILAAVGGGAAGLAVAEAVGEAGAGTAVAFGTGVAVAALAGGAIGAAFRGTQELLKEAVNDPRIDWSKVGGETAKGAINGMIDGVAGFLGLKIVESLPGFRSAAARYAVSIASESVIGGFTGMIQVVVEQWPKPDPHAIAVAGLIGAGLGVVLGAWGGRSAGKVAAKEAAERAAVVRRAEAMAAGRTVAGRRLIGEEAAQAAARLAAGDAAEKEFVENFLKQNIQNPNAMLAFYRRLGWNGVKELSGKIDSRLFNAIHWARDDAVRRAWADVYKTIYEKYGIRLMEPYVGSPPGSGGYKGAFSDIDMSMRVPEGSTLPAPERLRIELEAMGLMNQKLREATPTPGVDIDVNVYLQPTVFPQMSKAAAADVKAYAALMDFYEVRLGYGSNTAAWEAFKKRTLEVAAARGEKAGVADSFKLTEQKYAVYEGQVKKAAEARRAAGATEQEAETLAQQDVRQELENRVAAFLKENGKLLMESGPKAEAARAEYNRLQLEMRARWPEAYVGAPGAMLGASAKNEAEKLAARMSAEEISRAELSQARFILDWLGHDTRPVVQAWKAGKYQMRDLQLLERVYEFLPPAETKWIEFLKKLKGARTPQDAWAMWVERHYGNEMLAEQSMKEYLDLLRWETEEFLAHYLSRPGGTARPRPTGRPKPKPPSPPPPPSGGGFGGDEITKEIKIPVIKAGAKFTIKDPRIFRNAGRDIVVVETPWGPKAFYKRTGGGGADQGWAAKGNWVPFDGFLKHSGGEWFIKPKSGRMGEAGSEQVSKFLAEVWGKGDIHLGADVSDIKALNSWLRSNGVEVGGGYRVGEELKFEDGTEIVLEIP